MTVALPCFAEIRAVAESFPPNSGEDSLPRRAVAHPLIAMFAAVHGIAGDLPGGTSLAMESLVAPWLDGSGSSFPELAGLDSDFKLYELALHQPTADSRRGAAMNETGASLAASYGMMAVEPGIDLIVLSALGPGAAIAGDLVRRALVGRKTGGEAGPAAAAHADLIETALKRHRSLADPLEVLAALGGPDIAAMLGAILAARLAGIPVIVDGVAAHAAACVVRALRPDAISHCRLATSVMPGPLSRDDLPAILSEPIETPMAGIRALASISAG
jgi:nicotinate-nucleotide--dimethylbenzimidazole phosphoribosyltransferase